MSELRQRLKAGERLEIFEKAVVAPEQDDDALARTTKEAAGALAIVFFSQAFVYGALVPQVRQVWGMSLNTLSVAYMFIAGAHHIATWRFPRYVVKCLRKGYNPFRTADYALSSGIVLLQLALSVGMRDTEKLTQVVVAQTLCVLVGAGPALHANPGVFTRLAWQIVAWGLMLYAWEPVFETASFDPLVTLVFGLFSFFGIAELAYTFSFASFVDIDRTTSLSSVAVKSLLSASLLIGAWLSD